MNYQLIVNKARRRGPKSISDSDTLATTNSFDEVEKRFRRLGNRVRAVLSGGDKSNSDADDSGRSHVDSQTREPAESDGTRIYHELLSFLHGHCSTECQEMFWNEFLAKLKVLEDTSKSFRKSCLFQMRDGLTLFHEVCTLNPPVEAVKILMDIIPTSSVGRQFNHLGCTPKRFGNEYPLHMLAKYGGTLDAVKLLIDADPCRETLKLNSKNNSVYHVLVENRGYHSADEFSGILQYLVSIIEDFSGSPLLQENKRGHTPLLLLSESLANSHSELSLPQLLHQRDLAFTMKATCYHYLLSKGTESNLYKDYDYNDRRIEIEDISLSQIFTICSIPTCPSSMFLKESLTADAGCFEKKIMEKLAIQFERLESLGTTVSGRRKLAIIEQRKRVTMGILETILKPHHGASGGYTAVPLLKEERIKKLMKRYKKAAEVDQIHDCPVPCEVMILM